MNKLLTILTLVLSFEVSASQVTCTVTENGSTVNEDVYTLI